MAKVYENKKPKPVSTVLGKEWKLFTDLAIVLALLLQCFNKLVVSMLPTVSNKCEINIYLLGHTLYLSVLCQNATG